ncbi:MAG: class I SAM-dependent methyltransferase [Alphaproteobacteria bacterium]|nr:class I SAM-dependent methyltransferase [Alphaproteobacteria bacterium]
MSKKEYGFYNFAKDWDFSFIKSITENLTNWDMIEEIKKRATKGSKILDLGTGGGERVLEEYPEVQEIIGTDFSDAMIQTANENLKKSGKTNISFRVMDNLAMDTPDDYFDIVTARHTCIDPVRILKTLKSGGALIVRGVDQLDCWELKRFFGRGQAFRDEKAISQIDFESILDAGFKDVELVPIHMREYYETPEDLLALLHKAPILDDFSEIEVSDGFHREPVDAELFNQYVAKHKTKKGILLVRRYYGITAKKP